MVSESINGFGSINLKLALNHGIYVGELEIKYMLCSFNERDFPHWHQLCNSDIIERRAKF